LSIDGFPQCVEATLYLFPCRKTSHGRFECSKAVKKRASQTVTQLFGRSQFQNADAELVREPLAEVVTQGPIA
jgi:hypothetical protein